MIEYIATAVLLFAMTMPVLAIVVVVYCVNRLRQDEPVLELAPRRPTPWGLFEIGGAVLVFVPLQVAAVQGAVWLWQIPRFEGVGDLAPIHQAVVMTASAGATALLALLLQAVVALRSDDWTGDLGWNGQTVRDDLLLGLCAFSILAPVTYALQAIATQFVPSKHPLLEMVQTDEGKTLFAWAAVLAVFIAPWAEEILFRWFLQGWLEKAAWLGWGRDEVIVGGRPAAATPSVAPWNESGSEPLPAEQLPPVRASLEGMPDRLAGDSPAEEPIAAPINPYLAPPEVEPKIAPGVDPPFPTGWGAAWPILVSSAVFALLHLTHGPDWIALFVLSLGLGYLYQRTHRILPSIIVHFLLNAVSMSAAWLVISADPAV